MCDAPKCKRPGKPVYAQSGEKPVAYYCDHHAQRRGFCVGCGVHEFPEGEGVNESGYCLSCEMALEGLVENGTYIQEDEYIQFALFDW